jgi:hypothetical protein
MTDEALCDLACGLAQEAGWEFGGEIAGHLIVLPDIYQPRVTYYWSGGERCRRSSPLSPTIVFPDLIPEHRISNNYIARG